MYDKILVTQSSMPPFEEYVEEIKKLWDSHWLTNMGEEHKQLEEELKKYLNVQDISLMVNGHMALEMTLQSMKLSGEVITTPFTFASTTHAIVRNGLTPVFCDIKEDDYTIDASKIEELITEKTSAIVPVHVYGNICDVDKIKEIADKYDLKVIYDAAHAFGVEYNNWGVGNFGDASIFSFHATKVFNTIEGGAVTFKDEELGLDLYRLKNFGIRGLEKVDWIGANAKMNEFQAAMGICNLRHINEEIEKRKQIVCKYREYLGGIEGLNLCDERSNTKSNYAYFPIRIEADKYGMDRDGIYEKLKENNIYARKYFYPLTSEFECYKNQFDANETPVAKRVSEQVLTLPLYTELEDGQIERISRVIKENAQTIG